MNFPPYLGGLIKRTLAYTIDDTLETRLGYLGRLFLPEDYPPAENLLSRKIGAARRGVTVDLGKVIQHEKMFGGHEGETPLVLTVERNVERCSTFDEEYGQAICRMLAERYGKAMYFHVRQEEEDPEIYAIAYERGKQPEKFAGKVDLETRKIIAT